MTEMPGLLFDCLRVRAESLLLAQCHVGFAVIFIVDLTSFFGGGMKKAQALMGLGLGRWLRSTVKIIYAINLP